jgi:hypothetical protein
MDEDTANSAVITRALNPKNPTVFKIMSEVSEVEKTFVTARRER